MSKYTKGPWMWWPTGGTVLMGDHCGRPIVLSVRTHGPGLVRGLTSLVDGRLAPFDPWHPDSKLIAAAPELAEALVRMLDAQAGRNKSDLVGAIAVARAALRKSGVLP